MPLAKYGVLKGKLQKTVMEPKGGHLEILVVAENEPYRIALNVRSMAIPPELKYSVFKNFNHPITKRLEQLKEGITLKDAEHPDVGLDYIRGNLLDYRRMVTAHNIKDKDNELADFIQLYIDKALSHGDAEVYAFGQTWGGEDKADPYFGFNPGQGIHDIHMNQGNQGHWIEDNGCYQDGGMFIYFPKDNQWVAFFFAFQSQSFHTDSEGKPLFGIDSSIEQSVRIVSALLNPTKGSPAIGLINCTDKAIPLEGWSLVSSKDRVALHGDIAAGAYLQVLCSGMTFNKNGGILSLFNERGQKIDGVSYSTPNFLTADFTTVF